MSRKPQQTIELPCGPECRAYHNMEHVSRVLGVGLRQAYRRTFDLRGDIAVVRCDRIRALLEPEADQRPAVEAPVVRGASWRDSTPLTSPESQTLGVRRG